MMSLNHSLQLAPDPHAAARAHRAVSRLLPWRAAPGTPAALAGGPGTAKAGGGAPPPAATRG